MSLNRKDHHAGSAGISAGEFQALHCQGDQTLTRRQGCRRSQWLHRFAVLTALATLVLLGAGGLVTSHGVGLAVPDWPNTYGYNMFFFPFSKWVGGVFYEHSHRLVAAAVGLLTWVLAMWLWVEGTSARSGFEQEETERTEKRSQFSLFPPVRNRERFWGLGAMAAVFVLMGARQMPVYYALVGLAPVVIGASLFLAARERRQQIVGDDVRSLGPGEPQTLGDSSRRLLQGRWLRWLGVAAFAAVVLQGVLGGLRVVWLKDQIGILHAALAQLFFALVCALALFTSRWWRDMRWENGRLQSDRLPLTPALSLREREIESLRLESLERVGCSEGLAPPLPEGESRGEGESCLSSNKNLSRPFLFATLLILFQLILGATMRHQHAGLAIPDFPLAYGKLWPAMDAASVTHYNQQRLEVVAANPITALQIGLQMAHRLMALAILVAVAYCAWAARRRMGRKSTLSRLAWIWLGLICLQALVGAATIWSDKAADLATAHVIVGALALASGAMLTLIAFQGVASSPASASSPCPEGTSENSPTFQRWEPVIENPQVPKGRPMQTEPLEAL